MAAKTILPFGDPALRKIARPVKAITPKIEKLLDDLADTLRVDLTTRAAIAAPQIGILRRVIVIHYQHQMIELINPEIVELRGEQIGPEACLSFPGYTGIVKRAQYTKIKTLTRTGETVCLEGEGHLARCFQHEIDHLNGVLYIDHIKDHQLYENATQKPADLLAALRLSQAR